MTDQLASLHQKQKAFQAVHKFVHLKTPADRITSVLIPTVLCGTAIVLIGRGVYNMSFGKGKIEGK